MTDAGGPRPAGQAPTGATERRLCYALDNVDGTNKLYFGDNLKILRDYVEDASVDLIYLDPACRQAGRRSTPAPPIRQPTDSGARKRRRFTGKSSSVARASSPT